MQSVVVVFVWGGGGPENASGSGCLLWMTGLKTGICMYVSDMGFFKGVGAFIREQAFIKRKYGTLIPFSLSEYSGILNLISQLFCLLETLVYRTKIFLFPSIQFFNSLLLSRQ